MWLIHTISAILSRRSDADMNTTIVTTELVDVQDAFKEGCSALFNYGLAHFQSVPYNVYRCQVSHYESHIHMDNVTAMVSLAIHDTEAYKTWDRKGFWYKFKGEEDPRVLQLSLIHI